MQEHEQENKGKAAHGGLQARKKPNHLKGQTSPYLLQHLYNPVDWYPWGKEALEKAKKENKPIFLSIGYSACHWCHVMEEESFESEKIARVLNENFVCIKVDREERPDIDEIYMQAVNVFTRGRGGWPMSVFLTPEREAFYAGTYFPPTDRSGLPGFGRVLDFTIRHWKDEPDTARKTGKDVTEYLSRLNPKAPEGKKLDIPKMLSAAVQSGQKRFDKSFGGFGHAPTYAPKFPHATELSFYLRYGTRTKNRQAIEMAEKTLETMAKGGIYDQIGGGFHRYSVDRFWTVPHFEKMLYDNAQLAMLYLEAWQATKKEFYRDICVEILDYVRREMMSAERGFYSTTDADSEGCEGKFFVWSRAEIDRILADDAPIARRYFGVTNDGNFEGKNILTNRLGLELLAKETGKSKKELMTILDRASAKLYEARKKRVPPRLDDKILSSWNGLMLSAYARAAQVLERKDYLRVAQKNAHFLLDKMRMENGRLFRTRRKGRSHLGAFLEDYAFVTQGLIDLYEADPDPEWIAAAMALHRDTEKHFADKQRGGYYSTPDDAEKLIARMASVRESSLPSDLASAAMNAARLGLLAGDSKLIGRARETIQRFANDLELYPTWCSQLLILCDFLEARPREVFVAGDLAHANTQAFLKRVRTQFPPYRVLVHTDASKRQALLAILPTVEGKDVVDGKPAAYVCHEGVCQAPTSDPKELKD